MQYLTIIFLGYLIYDLICRYFRHKENMARQDKKQNMED